MLVVINDADNFHNNQSLEKFYELAGINFDPCFVVSGLKSGIQRIAEQLNRQNVTSQVLLVSVAFHSSLVDAEKENFANIFGDSVYRPTSLL
jgi:acyl transferase domain-containing protein